MVSILFMLIFNGLVSTASAQTPDPTYPRNIIKCQLANGELFVREDKAGEFFYSAPFDLTGEVVSGPAKISLMKRVGKEGAPQKCVLSVEGGEGEKKFSNEFSWYIDDGVEARPEAKSPEPTAPCVLKRRYSKSITNCVMPNAEEPGRQCHGEGGRDVTAVLPRMKGTLKSAKIVAYPGGMSFEVNARGIGDKTGKGFAIWRKPGVAGQWCYSLERLFPDRCQRLVSRLSIKNTHKQVVGVLEPIGEYVFYRPAKQPFMNAAFVLDPDATVLRLSSDNTMTQVTLFRKEGVPEGQITVLGESTLPGKFESYAGKPVELGVGKNWTSDCNGWVEQVAARPTPEPRAPLKLPIRVKQ